jgi:3-oxoacyl-[acyl-carrier protein] reductase
MLTLDFSGKAVLVTGGSAGIGLAIGRMFRDAGAAVTVTGTRPAAAYDTDFSRLSFAQVDVADDAAVRALADTLPRLDVLVNNAGTVLYRRAEYELANFRRVLDVNLTAMLHLCNLFQERLKISRGSVINISSLAGLFGTFGNPAYGASKAAVVQLTKTLAVAWGKDGIRVNAVAPGYVETKITAVSKNNPKIDEGIVQRTPLGRWIEADEVAGAVLWLASPLASGVTGQNIAVDGGFSAGL